MIPPRATVLTVGLCLLVVWVPFPAGSVTPPARLVLQMAVLALLLLAAGVPGWRYARRRVGRPAAGLVALAALAAVQALPLPALAVRLVSPELGRLWDEASPAAVGEPASVAQLSLAPARSLVAALGFATAAAALLVAGVAGGRRRRRRLLGAGVALAAVAVLLAGTREWVAGAVPRLVGTYVNANHLAVLLEIALAVTFAWILGAVRLARSEPALERRFLFLAPPVLVWLVLAAGIVFTGSRAGILALLCLVGFQAVIARRVLPNSRAPLVVGVGLVAVALLLLPLALRQGLGRLLSTSIHEVAFNQRLEAWKLAAGLVPRFPVTGTGFGTFIDAFPLVQSDLLVGATWGRAHNDYLELAISGGLLGSLGAAFVLGTLASQLWRVLTAGLRTEDRAAGLAALGALVAVGVHEVFDFGLTLPANALVFCVVAGGASTARLRSSGLRSSRPAAARERDQPPPDR